MLVVPRERCSCEGTRKGVVLDFTRSLDLFTMVLHSVSITHGSRTVKCLGRSHFLSAHTVGVEVLRGRCLVRTYREVWDMCPRSRTSRP
jgi:hypothetical protein